MYFDKKIQNKYTIGKHLRRLKRLRKKDSQAKRILLPPQLKEYKESLQSKGMKIAHMDLGLFQTKNGLKYSGFIATEDIPTNSVLLRVPVDCLLTTRDAFLSQIQNVFEQNPKFYAKTFSSDWEDRILLTYLLFEHQKGKSSKWYHLIRNLPRQIDYIIFWKDEEINLIEDEWVTNNIFKQRKRVIKQQDQLIKIAEKYPQYFDMSVFTRQNIKWIHVHLVTRCFGKYFQYTTMVPYAQLFNHQCTDVYYTMAYNPDNPNDNKQVLDPPKTITDQEADQAQSSDGSYNASDVSAEDEDFQEKDPFNIENIKTSCDSEIRSLESYLAAFVSFNDGISLPYLVKVFQQMEDVRNHAEQNQSSSKRLQILHSTNVKYVKLVKQFYNKLSYTTYTYGLRQKKKWKQNNKKQQQIQVDQNERYFQGPWKKDNFDQFLMVCSSKDQYQEGSQVYFCYGRLPNRLLLMRYGISLEHNKYNHLFIRIDISEIVYHSQPLLKYVISEIALKKYRRFKIKRTQFCCQLLTFHRALLWKYNEDVDNIFYIHDIEKERRVLNAVEGILRSKLLNYKQSLIENQQLLAHKDIGYHQYFAIVYKIQQQRILIAQLQMIDYAKQILSQIESGHPLHEVLKTETNQSKIRYQLMMSIYFKYFKIENWQLLA